MSIARISTVTLYHLAFFRPVLGEGSTASSNNILTDGGVRLGEIRFRSRLRVRAISPKLCFRSLFLAKWLKLRRYRHFDLPVNDDFVSNVMQPNFVAQHSFSPLIGYVKSEKRYKKSTKQTILKSRSIMYASHRDACIFAWYNRLLNSSLESYYARLDLNSCVLAYRALGKANFDFATDAYAFSTANGPVDILAFDVTGFFDNLDHKRLKTKLKQVLGVSELSVDWYKVLRNVTR